VPELTTRLLVRTKPRVRVYADSTPATISAEVSALKVFLPRE